ncbi:hypothetical protein MCOR25_007205 [Pyricularia grisea]|uniref:Rhodopsin domain-containing protein n=1 Tax=Pyricularia grisea TaxID=148305 RepID=A0A6P8B2G3_PYRGI|nr:uncharacterized protein PgNI_07186 [Pyricularia grisea]KAI6358940.1 hypothetical protein MCOR25_007205 [Pyricularia grisea]TLD09095.1 hypothetical protein PgNI_07186 [Pyricularia grisea]
MGSATSKEMAAAVLIPLPFALISMLLRFWIRARKNTWGPDDWAMVATVPVWLVTTISTIVMAWSGVGQQDDTLTSEQMANSYMWFYIFQESWCFVLVTLKWSIGFTLLRIAGGKRWVTILIYSCLVLVTICTGGTGMFLFFGCDPVQKNWYPELPGTCHPREIQTALSFLVAAVSIFTDWVFAILPAVLIWKLQMPSRVKMSVIGLLGLGFFASIAPIVRLRYLLLMNDATRFVQNLGIILAWAIAEVGVGLLVANLPACRPLLERALSRLTSFTGSKGKTLGPTNDPETARKASYLELGEQPGTHGGGGKKGANSRAVGTETGTSNYGVETRIYGRDDTRGQSIESLGADQESMRRIVAKSSSGAIRVQTKFGFEVENDRMGGF